MRKTNLKMNYISDAYTGSGSTVCHGNAGEQPQTGAPAPRRSRSGARHYKLILAEVGERAVVQIGYVLVRKEGSEGRYGAQQHECRLHRLAVRQLGMKLLANKLLK